MTNRTAVPKFGDWNQDSPFTVVFEKASRSKKDSVTSNPNEYPDMTPNPSQSRNPRQDQPPNQNVTPRHERYRSMEDTESRASPAHNNRNNLVRGPSAPETYNHPSYGGGGRLAGTLSEPHRRQQHDPPPVQPRPIRNLRGQNRERVATIPPFPISGSENQSYTLIFDKVKEDRNQSARSYNGTSQSTPSQPMNDQRHQPLPSSPKGCCFPLCSRKSY